ncbi:NACHT domain-containing protein [Streptomyces flaveus]|uniref:NACHT domain-containing protein n=1 Tax=Streptomyces flaveus TaxID=66370 RepID=UPI0033302A57
MPAEAVLRLEGDGVLIAGPGGGKSSLLRMEAATLAEQWEHGDGGMGIPVHIQAAALVEDRPLPEAIAASVRADQHVAGLREEWSAAFFRDRPASEMHWLVLVDGLDEIMDPERRYHVLMKLRRWREQDLTFTHRFVIASRALPGAEWATLGAWPHYELLPLGVQQLSGFATAWFAAAGMDHASTVAQQFTAEVRRSRLHDLARTPLMAAMLCQLFAAHTNKPLPTGRYALYKAYLELRYKDWNGEGTGAALVQIRTAATEKLGAEAAQTAQQLYRQIPDLISRLALARWEGETRSTVDVLREWTAHQAPHLPEATWRALIQDALRYSGLLIEQGDDFVFLHQTLLEFLAAQQMADDNARSASFFRFLFGWRGRRGVPLSDHLPESSFFRFVIPAWQDRERPGLTEALRHWAMSPEGASLLAILAKDGTSLSPVVIHAATTTLVDSATGPFLHSRRANIWVARDLAWLGDERGVEALAARAADPVVRDGHTHMARPAAAEALVELGDARGMEALTAMLDDPTLVLGNSWKCGAAQVLARMGDPRGIETLTELAADVTDLGSDGVLAARVLAHLGDPRGVDALIAYATVPGRSYDWRRDDAAEALTELRDPRSAEALFRIAVDASLGPRSGEIRVKAAETLVDVGDPRGPEALEFLAAYSAEEHNCHRAAKALARAGDARGVARLAALATDGDTEGTRDWAVHALIQQAHPRIVETLASLASHSAVHPMFRMQLAEALGVLGDPRAVETLTALASDTTLPRQRRRSARRALRLLQKEKKLSTLP